jgi:hypothetical protein
MIPVPLEEEAVTKSKYTNKFGSVTGVNHTIILSMKSKKVHDVDAETVDGVRKLLGLPTSDVTIVDSAEITYDSQGGWS